MKALYYGDYLQVLRDSIATESVDLIYLDPLFKSKATYNVRCWRVSRPQFRAAACPFIAISRLSVFLNRNAIWHITILVTGPLLILRSWSGIARLFFAAQIGFD